MLARFPYALVCTALGLLVGWAPRLVHGPIPQKFDALYIDGAIAVWAFYAARLSIGFMIGITTWPRPWFVRGPLIGALMVLPVVLIALATPGCGNTCGIVNMTSGIAIGTVVAGAAYALTGRHSA
jgi:hypothetical protein